MWQALGLDQSYAYLSEEDFMAHGQMLALPDGGTSLINLAEASPGGAFDPREAEQVPPEKLGYDAEWFVERYPFYGLDWDITGLRFKELEPYGRSAPLADHH